MSEAFPRFERETAEEYDPTPKLRPIPEYLTRAYKKRQIQQDPKAWGKRGVNEAFLREYNVIASDALRENLDHYPRSFFLSDVEIAILNCLFETNGAPISLVELGERLSSSNVGHKTFRRLEDIGLVRQCVPPHALCHPQDIMFQIDPSATLDDKRKQNETQYFSSSLSEIQDQLRRENYVVLRDQDLGFGLEFRNHLLTHYFNTDIVRKHKDDVPHDRERARDVARVAFLPQPGLYVTNDDAILPVPAGLYLSRHPHTDVGLRRKSNISHRPEYSRVESLQDLSLTRFLAALNNLVPPEDHPPTTTMGVNFFRTYTDVVATPHQDEENYIFVYVVDKVGYGARTRLYRRYYQTEGFKSTPHTSVILEPGMMIVFKDSDFQHFTSQLFPLPTGQVRRDVMVCTLNYASSHPW